MFSMSSSAEGGAKVSNQKTVPMDACPGCGSTRGIRVDGFPFLVFECAKCGGVVGTCYLGESYHIVRPFFSKADVPAEKTRYFDFTTLGSEGVGRRHGWFDPETRLVVQTG